MTEPPRYAPERPFPPYAYVPGRTPHPHNDPKGHSYGVKSVPVQPSELNGWARLPQFLFSVDLFNHGYYWEAHEGWEEVWFAAGCHAQAGLLTKALIKLAAAALKGKLRQQRPAESLATKARAHLAHLSGEVGGIAISDLVALCDEVPQWQSDATVMYARPIVLVST